ncbi:hypothetical protein EYZ11_011603 [Aspergillus tanneri]|uniref:Uncharacterized protein n=1 Tax=Aspergillus tanneri TaxID=1220188 RepID=A0A4S3J2D8_9EURO|nr:hypothetical protein EYZ11_011603 [Aspergillus tanneri]
MTSDIPCLDRALLCFSKGTHVESVLALATQSAYTAANTFQELLRPLLTPPGITCIDSIVWLHRRPRAPSKNTTSSNLMAGNNVLDISEHEVLRVLELAFLNNETALPLQGKEPWLGAAEDPLSAATLVTCMDPRSLTAHKQEGALTGGARRNIPRWYTDSRVFLVMRAFVDAERHRQRANDAQSTQRNLIPTYNQFLI